MLILCCSSLPQDYHPPPEEDEVDRELREALQEIDDGVVDPFDEVTILPYPCSCSCSCSWPERPLRALRWALL